MESVVEILFLGDMINIMISFTSIGLLLGLLMLIIGLAISGVVKIFKQV